MILRCDLSKKRGPVTALKVCNEFDALQGESAARARGTFLIHHEERDQAPLVREFGLLALWGALSQPLDHNFFQNLPLENHVLAGGIESLVGFG